MNALERILSRPAAKPYRTRDLEASHMFLNDDGHLDFAPGDRMNPKNWSNARKTYISFVTVLLVVNATFASSSPSGALPGISKTFGVSEEAANLVTSLFLLGYVAGPFFWAPLSEFYGRRWIFYITFTCYLIFNFLCAWAPNFAALLIGRFLCGTFVSAPLSNGPGVLVDIWDPVGRGNAMAAFSMMTFCGPAMGPVISGFLQLKEDWRWTFYVLLWLGGISAVLMFTIPETLAPAILSRHAQRIRAAKIPGYEDVKAAVETTDRSLRGMFTVALTRPWKILVDPISFFCAIYLSVVYALLYMLFTIYPIVFQQKRHWNSGVGELPLIGSALGAVIGAGLIFVNSKRDQKRVASGYKARPEDRLPVAMVGGVLFPITMFWFAWSAEYNSVPWIVPTLAGIFLSCSILLIFVAYLNYLTDTYLMYAASALAANTVCRSAFGAAAPLYTEYMFDALGVGGGGSLVGGVACLLAPIPFIFYKYGEPIRKRSPFAPTPDKAADVKQEVPREQQPGTAAEEHEEEIEEEAEGDVDKKDLEGDVPREEYEGDGPHSSLGADEKYIESGMGLDRVQPAGALEEVGGGVRQQRQEHGQGRAYPPQEQSQSQWQQNQPSSHHHDHYYTTSHQSQTQKTPQDQYPQSYQLQQLNPAHLQQERVNVGATQPQPPPRFEVQPRLRDFF